MPRSTLADVSVAAAFVIAVALPGTLHAVAALSGGGEGVLARENRAMASFPSRPDISSVRGYTAGIEAWLDDRFGLRAPMLAAYEAVQAGLRLNAASDAAAVEGREGWLFLGMSGKRRDDHRALAPLSPEVLAEWAAFAARWEAAAEARGADAFAMTPPDKQTLYPEYLPASFGAPMGPRRRDAVSAVFEGAGVPVADPLDAMRARKADIHAEGLTFFHRTDTHWNAWGAFEGYRALVETVRAAGHDAPMLEREAVARGTVREGYAGDLVAMLGQGERSEDVVRATVAGQDGLTRRWLDDAERDDMKTVVITGGPVDAPSLYVSGDSFSFALLPYLGHSFSEVTVSRRAGVVDLGLLDRHPADIVLFEQVERNMRQVPTVKEAGEEAGAEETEGS